MAEPVDGGVVVVRLLGVVEIEAPGGGVVEVRAAQQRLVLAVLANAADRPVTTEALIDAVWDEPPEGALKTLRVLVSRVKGLLERASSGVAGRITVVRRSGGYLLSIPREQVDVHRVRSLAEQARRAGVSADLRARLLDQAMDLWRGDPLAGLGGRWAQATRRGWQADLLSMVVDWAHAQTAVGHTETVIGALTRLVAQHPLDENIGHALIGALHQAGRVADALDHYASLRDRLREDLGRDPNPNLQRLHYTILNSDTAPAGTTTTAATSTPAVKDVRGESHLAQVSRNGVLPPVWNVPPRATDLIPRAELIAKIRERLAQGPVVLAGLPGVGKTRLAGEYAYSFANGYDLAWWVASEQVDLIGGQIAELAYELKLTPRTSDVAVAGAALRRHMRGIPGERVLLIFDNAVGPDHIQPQLPDHGHVLITSRNPYWIETANVMKIDVFTRAESRRLLQDRVSGLSITDADRIASQLGDLPLGLAQAAGLISQRALTADEYLAALASQTAVITALGTPTGYPTPLAAAVRMSTQTLVSASPRSAWLLDVCAHLAPEPIPIRLLSNASPSFESPHHAPAGSSHDISTADLRELLPIIGKLGLATLGQGHLQLHRLVRAIIRDQQGEAGRRALSDAQRLLVRCDPGDIGTPAHRPLWRELIPHLLFLQPGESDQPAFRDLASRAVTHLLVHGDYQPGLMLAIELYEHWSSRFGPDNLETLQVGRRLAMARFIQGDLGTALRLREHIHERLVAILGPDHPEALITAQHLCWSHEDDNRPIAKSLLEDTLARQRRVLGHTHPDTLLSAATLAMYFADEGDIDAAVTLAQTTYNLAVAALGEMHPWALIPADILARCLMDAGRLDDAQALAERTLENATQHLGKHNSDTLEFAASLANILHRQGQTARARQLAERTLALYRHIFHEEHPATKWLKQRMSDIVPAGRC